MYSISGRELRSASCNPKLSIRRPLGDKQRELVGCLLEPRDPVWGSRRRPKIARSARVAKGAIWMLPVLLLLSSSFSASSASGPLWSICLAKERSSRLASSGRGNHLLECVREGERVGSSHWQLFGGDTGDSRRSAPPFSPSDRRISGGTPWLCLASIACETRRGDTQADDWPPFGEAARHALDQCVCWCALFSVAIVN